MRAGAATAVISPLSQHLEEGVYLGGYGGYRSRRATGLHDDIYARALVLSDASTTMALVALDLVGISHAHLAHIGSQASRRTGIPFDNILIASTHSHASPDLQGLWGGVPAASRRSRRGPTRSSPATSRTSWWPAWSVSSAAWQFMSTGPRATPIRRRPATSRRRVASARRWRPRGRGAAG